jgi:thiamine pyrophosphate-dependent acetolactate synthase large subunit-like protein
MIARTAPQGPVYVCLDAAMQEAQLEEMPQFYDVSRYRAPSPVAPAPEDLAEAIKLIKAAKNPLILMGRVSRSEKGWDERVKLAEAMGARVFTGAGCGAAFPSNHPLHLGTFAYILRGRPPRAAQVRPSSCRLGRSGTPTQAAAATARRRR